MEMTASPSTVSPHGITTQRRILTYQRTIYSKMEESISSRNHPLKETHKEFNLDLEDSVYDSPRCRFLNQSRF